MSQQVSEISHDIYAKKENEEVVDDVAWQNWKYYGARRTRGQIRFCDHKPITIFGSKEMI